MEKKNHRMYAVAGVPFLLAYGVPALLVACVVSGSVGACSFDYKNRKEAKAKGSGNGRGMSIKKEHNSYAPFFVC